MPAKTATKSAPAPVETEVSVESINLLELELPEVTDKPLPVDLSKIPQAIKDRVDTSYASGDDKWRFQATASEAQAEAVLKAMTKYAINRPAGRVTLRKRLGDGGFYFKAVKFVPKPKG